MGGLGRRAWRNRQGEKRSRSDGDKLDAGFDVEALGLDGMMKEMADEPWLTFEAFGSSSAAASSKDMQVGPITSAPSPEACAAPLLRFRGMVWYGAGFRVRSVVRSM